MANINKSMELLKQVEYSNNNSKILGINKGENGLTFFGIYEIAHPSWEGWSIIKRYLVDEPDLEKCSNILANVSDLIQLVYKFYKREFWDKASLDLVNKQKIADEIFLFGVNAGMNTAVKKAQELVGVVVDGSVGQKTIEAFNNYNENKFSQEYDYKEKKYYDDVIASKPAKAINKKGWYARADYI